MKESEAWREAAEIADDARAGLCYGLDRLHRAGKLDERLRRKMTRIIQSAGERRRGPNYQFEADYVWQLGDPERKAWAEEQARLAEREEARDAATSKMSDLPGRDEGAGNDGELPVVPVPVVWNGDLRGAEQRAFVGGAGDAAGTAGGGEVSDLSKNVPAKPVRRYRVEGTYNSTFEIEVEATDSDGAKENAKEGVEAGLRDLVEFTSVEETYGSMPRCPNCGQALDLEE